MDGRLALARILSNNGLRWGVAVGQSEGIFCERGYLGLAVSQSARKSL